MELGSSLMLLHTTPVPIVLLMLNRVRECIRRASVRPFKSRG